MPWTATYNKLNEEGSKKQVETKKHYRYIARKTAITMVIQFNMYIYIYFVASLECRFCMISDVAILGDCFCMISSHPLLQHLPEN